MSRHNTRKIKKIVTGLAIALGITIWVLIFLFVSKTESDRRIRQEKQVNATQSIYAHSTSVTPNPVENEETGEKVTKQDTDKSSFAAQNNTKAVNENNMDETSNYTDNNNVMLSGMNITKADFGLSNVDNVSRDDIIKVAAPKFAATKTNEAGSYVTYEGTIYRLPDGHIAGTTWDNTTKVPTNIGDEIVATKSEIHDLENGTIAQLREEIYGGISKEVLGSIASFENKDSNGIVYTWNKDHSQCEIKGITESASFCNLVNSTNSMPAGLQNGRTYDLTFNAVNDNVSLVIIPYSNGSELGKESIKVRGTVRYTIPPTWNGIVIRLSVKHMEGGTSVNETVNSPEIKTVPTVGIESQINKLNLITNSAQLLEKNMFPILTLIDDDAISVDQVERFTAACESVGVRGTLACITSSWESSPEILKALKKAEENGHNAVIHAYSQRPGDCWSSEGYDPEECMKNLVKGMRMMQEAGFSNYKYWVTPFNRDSEDMRKIARNTGCNCRFYGGGHANTIYDNYEIDRYGIYRVGITERTEEEIHAIIDDCYDKKGWLVFITHFYENPDEITVKFSDAIIYAKEKGFMIATAPEAWSYRKSIYDLADMF